MAFAKIILKNPATGAVKEAPVGFAWTVFFFGFFPALFRGDAKWLLIMLVLSIFTFGLSGLVFMFIYNKLYLNDLIDKGFKAQSISNGDLSYVSTKLGIEIPRLEVAAA